MNVQATLSIIICYILMGKNFQKYLCGGGARPYFRVRPDLAGTRSGVGVRRDLVIPGRMDCGFGMSGRIPSARASDALPEAADIC